MDWKTIGNYVLVGGLVRGDGNHVQLGQQSAGHHAGGDKPTLRRHAQAENQHQHDAMSELLGSSVSYSKPARPGTRFARDHSRFLT